MKIYVEVNDDVLKELENKVPKNRYVNCKDGLIGWIRDYMEGSVDELVEEWIEE